jgi:hypothetical protein
MKPPPQTPPLPQSAFVAQAWVGSLLHTNEQVGAQLPPPAQAEPSGAFGAQALPLLLQVNGGSQIPPLPQAVPRLAEPQAPWLTPSEHRKAPST